MFRGGYGQLSKPSTELLRRYDGNKRPPREQVPAHLLDAAGIGPRLVPLYGYAELGQPSNRTIASGAADRSGVC